jgi:uncharacterized protein (TIGR02453 family)
MSRVHFNGFPSEGLQFLKQLKRNNNREWFNEHKTTYEESVRKPMQQLVELLADELSKFAPEIQASPKTSLYRIYRDTRFSKDKSPYKTHVAAVFPPRALGKHEGAGYYFHISPGELLVGGGLYMPAAEDLKAVREALAREHRRFARILQNRSFRRMFGELTGERLSRVPRGFAATHPAAEYLRYKQFLAARQLPSESAASRNFSRTLIESFKTLHPFIEFLNEPILAGRRTRQRQESLLK